MVLMLKHPPLDVAGYADVENAPGYALHNVNVIAVLAAHTKSCLEFENKRRELEYAAL